MASGSGESFFDPYDLCTEDDENLMLKNIAEITSGCSDRIAHILRAARLYSDSLAESPKNWGQVNAKLNDSHSDRMQIGSTFWI